MKPLLLAVSLMLLLTLRAQAQDKFTFDAPELRAPQMTLTAQNDGDDAYDPFSDYSEFDEASDEEADINFFRNGRFFVLGFQGGWRGFDGQLQSLYQPGSTYGLFMTYFFDLRFAMQLGFLTGDNSYEFDPPVHLQNKVTGDVSMTFMDLSLKYYLNTQNVTRGFADLNPYIIGGISQIYRTITLSGGGGSEHDGVMGLHLGAGVEIPLLRKKAFFGLQAMYRYFNFPNSGDDLQDSIGNSYNVQMQGNSYDLTGTIGINF